MKLIHVNSKTVLQITVICILAAVGLLYLSWKYPSIVYKSGVTKTFEPPEPGVPAVMTTLRKEAQMLLNSSSLINMNIPENISGFNSENWFTLAAVAVEIVCSQVERIGNKGEGGWSVCVQGRYAFQKPCLVYSFGINNDWSFDDGIVNTHGCIVRSFDPSMVIANQKRGSNIYFYKEGLSGRDIITSDKVWRLNTLSSVLKIFNEENVTIDYLKIDIEYYEWESLDTSVRDGSLERVKQLGVEIHTDELYGKTTSLENYSKFFKVLNGLRKIGFYKWYTHLNPLSISATSTHSGKKIMCCYEFVYLNSKYT